jgi:hypothetical protein
MSLQDSIRRYRRLLKVLDREKQQAQGVVSVVLMEQAQMLNQIRSRENLVVQTYPSGWSEDMSGVGILTNLVISDKARQRLQDEIQGLEGQRDEHLEEAVQPAREKLEEALTRCRMMETLLEHKAEDLRNEMLRAEGKLLDEAGRNQWLQRKRVEGEEG